MEMIANALWAMFIVGMLAYILDLLWRAR